MIRELTSQMDLAAANLEFEKAAELRDTIKQIKDKALVVFFSSFVQ
jgi:excinuclease UvrABC nuclease subunit